MVDFQVVQAAYYMVAATGVLVAAVYYVITLRNSDKARAREIMYTRSQMHRLEFYNALNVVFSMTGFSTYEEFNEKYGRYTNPDAYANFLFIGWVYNNAGLLVKEKLATPKQVISLYNPTTIIAFWEKFECFAKGFREANNYLEYWEPLESLYRDVKKLYPLVHH